MIRMRITLLYSEEECYGVYIGLYLIFSPGILVSGAVKVDFEILVECYTVRGYISSMRR